MLFVRVRRGRAASRAGSYETYVRLDRSSGREPESRLAVAEFTRYSPSTSKASRPRPPDHALMATPKQINTTLSPRHVLQDTFPNCHRRPTTFFDHSILQIISQTFFLALCAASRPASCVRRLTSPDQPPFITIIIIIIVIIPFVCFLQKEISQLCSSSVPF